MELVVAVSRRTSRQSTGTGCSACGGPLQNSHRYCNGCHAAYMRDWRKTHRLTGEARRKMNARAYANVYQRRGKLAPRPCEICGDGRAQKHHENYDRPLEVRWLCRECHLALHRGAVQLTLDVAA